MLLVLLHKLQHIPRRAKVICLIVLAVSLMLFGMGLSSVSARYINYMIYPVTIISLAAASYMAAKSYPRLIFRNAEDKEYMVVGVTMLWGIGYFLLGLIFTYGKNPLAASLLSIVTNLWVYIVPIIAIEVVRFSVLRIIGRTKLWYSLVVVAVLSTLQVSLLPAIVGRGATEIIPWLISVVMPIVLYNSVATYLAVFAGLRAATLFHVGIYLILTTLPIVPNLDWYLVGMGALILAMMIYFTVGSARQDRRLSFRGRVASADGVVANVVSGVFVLVFVLFMANVFTYQPLAIMSNSMKDTYARGDLVIVRSIEDTSSVAIGDIIRYQKDATTITHRVVDVKHSEGGGGGVYTTKGDNNTSADAWPVTPDMISGVVTARIPLIGYPSILLYESLRSGGAMEGLG